MILAVDVHYADDSAYVAGVLFSSWQSKSAEREYTSMLSKVADYEPGNFYKRELPCILRLLSEHRLEPECIVIDGYVFLDGSSSPGLGKHLYDALNATTPVVGVAKKPFRGITENYQVFRGASKRPLYVTAAGIPLDEAKRHVQGMSGTSRIPELLKRTDQLCRGNR
ncbi:MAG: endonuclease V [Granulosicoccaceae bacterium]|jgi:deoxyribonuclease V